MTNRITSVFLLCLFGNVFSQLSNSGSCTCVPFYKCDDNMLRSLRTDDQVIDLRIRDGPCRDYLEICCKSPRPENWKDIRTSPLVKSNDCGNRNAAGVGFKITGYRDNVAQFGEFPWMVAVLKEELDYRRNTINKYQCGGALIHRQVVLTIAHCIKSRSDKLKIRAGEWDTQTTNEIYEHQDRYVNSIVTHRDFNPTTAYNDVALLFLKGPVNLAQHINVICLPPQGMVLDASKCFATGWGSQVFGKENEYQVILKKIKLPVVDRFTCENSFRRVLGGNFQLHESFICAGGEQGVDTCTGDGGSPLVCPIPGTVERYFQAGIVAWGVGCGGAGIPGSYVNVAHFRNWINEQMILNRFDVSGYTY